MYEVTASIVIYENDTQELLSAIHSFLNTELNIKLFLVDNSSSDKLKAILPDDERIDYHFIGENLGFGKAHNIVLEKVKTLSKYHLVLNPDISFEKGVIETLYEYMENHQEVGLSTADILLPSGERPYGCRLFPKPSTLILRRILPNVAKDVFTTLKYDKVVHSPWISGCFMFVRTAMFDSVGLFDPRYFMYCEDLDFSRRIRQNGWDIVNCPIVKAEHKQHRDSARKMKLFLIHLTSAFKYFNKWGWIFDEERDRINKELSDRAIAENG